MTCEIKTSGCRITSEQRFFSDTAEEWVFDYPGNFYSAGEYKINNASFREANAFIAGTFSVVGDVYFHNLHLGKTEITRATSTIYWPTFDEFYNFIEKKGLPEIPKADKESLENLISKSLLNWGNLRRAYNKNKTGIPSNIYIEYQDKQDSTPLLRVGLKDLAYFPVDENKPEVFATPYFETGKPNFLDRVGAAYEALLGKNDIILNKSDITRKNLKRVNLSKGDYPGEFIRGYGEEMHQFKIGSAFSELTKYALTCPTVSRNEGIE